MRAVSRISKWLYGLMSGVIGGGANAAVSSLGVAVAGTVGIKVPLLDLKQIGVIFMSGAVISALFYLKQSPLPPTNGNEPPP